MRAASLLRIEVAVVLAALGTPGCSDFGEVPDPLYATSDGQRLKLTNSTHEVLYFFVGPTQALGFIDWTPIPDPTNWTDKVLPLSTTSKIYQDLWWVKKGYNYRDLTVFWWRLIPQSDGTFKVDRVHSFTTTL